MHFAPSNLTKTFKAITLAVMASSIVSCAHSDVNKVAGTNPQLSVQLWSVQDAMKADFEGNLTKLAAMGIQGVEFAGIFGSYANDPVGLKTFLNSLGLEASGAHVPFSQFTPDKFDATVKFYKALGCNYLIIPMDQRAFNVDGAKVVAAELEAIQKKLDSHGMRIGYHNHKPEMLGELGKTPWDVIGKGTTSKVILQQDVGWTEVAGKDPVVMVKAYPGRTITTHYKASAPEPGNPEDPIIGQDTTDWKALITANKAYGGTQWLVVEQESYPEGMTPMQSVEASVKGLQKIIDEMK